MVLVAISTGNDGVLTPERSGAVRNTPERSGHSVLSSQELYVSVPTVTFRGSRIDCERGALLRDVLLSAEESPHNGASGALNCHGHGTCGTCAVAVEGPTSEPTAIECRRLSFPPHELDDGLRLACQTRVEGDLSIVKYEGFWGHRVEE